MSMLEHDPYWEQSLVTMCEHMKDDGIFILGWGGVYTQAHNVDCSPENVYMKIPANTVVDRLEQLGLYVHEARYEDDKRGFINIVAFKDKEHAIGEPELGVFEDKDLKIL